MEQLPLSVGKVGNLMDEIHNHPTVQNLLKWQRRHHYIFVAIVVAVGVLAAFWVHDYYFVPRSVL